MVARGDFPACEVLAIEKRHKAGFVLGGQPERRTREQDDGEKKRTAAQKDMAETPGERLGNSRLRRRGLLRPLYAQGGVMPTGFSAGFQARISAIAR